MKLICYFVFEGFINGNVCICNCTTPSLCHHKSCRNRGKKKKNLAKVVNGFHHISFVPTSHCVVSSLQKCKGNERDFCFLLAQRAAHKDHITMPLYKVAPRGLVGWWTSQSSHTTVNTFTQMSWLKPSGPKSYERPIKKGFRGNFSQIKKLLTTGRSICVAGAEKWETLESRCRNQREDRIVRDRNMAWEGSPTAALSWEGPQLDSKLRYELRTLGGLLVGNLYVKGTAL